ncbi:lipopolysaccharide transport system ATP-binding protein [Algoriphagus boseongensis]|uniref:Lipopolysaccharide transport system ATP-binding protein n=1 Tax=Algoriphagus boseongensis TaxID=1442587 RepID=A0A4R6T939_9BACT|nr:polysaccharide ABC transporter ATP-binding protein [Algoriphagus boseongensis]TDQ19580.1 lipopolysaccharide transport system ATP-binding protein [Algoriphagus boseongensis]
MSKAIISVSNLSKRYRISLREKSPETLIGKISSIFRYPINNLKKLTQLNQFAQEDDSVFWALKDISFEVQEGEVLGIIGRNGAGKSTLLKILSQITEPTSGKIEIQGRVASLLEVGTGFHPELSGRENIYMNGTILGMTRREIDSKLYEIIDFSGVEKFIDTPVKFYSSGMKVRLGFSVAAHLDPEILIIDEVLAVGDYEFQKKCLGKMKDVAGQGRTVLFVSHNLEAIKSLCSSAILFENGILKDSGAPLEVIKTYLKDSSISNYQFFWDGENRPGNEWIRVNSILASTPDFHFKGFFDRKDEIEVSVEFELLRNKIPTNLSLVLLSDTGEIILNAYSQIPVPILNAGNYSGTCKIPGNFLNDEVYKITMMFVKDTSEVMFSLEEALRFEILDTDKRETVWLGKQSGYVRPLLDFVLHG